MTYIVIAAIIVFASSIRTLSFAFWQFKNKNIIGGVMLSILGLTAAVLICMQF